MAKTKTSWEPGQSGNPSGRPRKSKALTDILTKGGSRSFIDIDGKRRAGKRIMARALWQLVTTGEAELAGPINKRLVASPKDWLETVKWLYARIDGPPPSIHEITGAEGAPIAVAFTWVGIDQEEFG